MRRLATSLLAVCAGLASREARATESWNQWDDAAAPGVARGAVKLAIGVDLQSVAGGDDVLRVAIEGEHLLRDHWGLFVNAAVPVSGSNVAPLLAGVRFHLLPKTWLDPFLGAAGGVARITVGDRDARVDPMVSAQAGAAVYYFGLFFVQAEARYDVARYAAADGAIDRSGVGVDGKLGVYF